MQSPALPPVLPFMFPLVHPLDVVGGSFIFKGLYRLDHNPDAEGVEFMVSKVYGAGPPSLISDQVQKYYKYNSAKKEFDSITTKTFGLTVDAIALPPMKSSRPASSRR